MDAERCYELGVKHETIVGELNTQKQRTNAIAERLDELIDEVAEVKRVTVSKDRFDQLSYDLSKLRENQVSKDFFDAVREEIKNSSITAKENFKAINKWFRNIAIALTLMFVMLIGALFLVMGEASAPYLHKIVEFVFKVAI